MARGAVCADDRKESFHVAQQALIGNNIVFRWARGVNRAYARMRPVPSGKASWVWRGGVARWSSDYQGQSNAHYILIICKHEKLIYGIEILFPQKGIYKLVPLMKFQAIDSSLPQLLLTFASFHPHLPIITNTSKPFLSMKFTIISGGRLGLFALAITQFSLILAHPSIEKRAVPIAMGAAKTYGAIAATTLTSTGNTLITGDCGTCPGTSISGFPPGVCTGTKSAGGTAACAAEAACLSAYNNARALASTATALPSSDLAGLSLAPGVYKFPTSAATNSAILTLNGATNTKGQFIFLINTTFTTTVSSKVLLINGAQACNVYFIVGSSATIGGATAMNGNILAYTSIGVANAASNKGTLCALNGAVTLINNALTAQTVCTS